MRVGLDVFKLNASIFCFLSILVVSLDLLKITTFH